VICSPSDTYYASNLGGLQKAAIPDPKHRHNYRLLTLSKTIEKSRVILKQTIMNRLIDSSDQLDVKRWCNDATATVNNDRLSMETTEPDAIEIIKVCKHGLVSQTMAAVFYGQRLYS
jgi:hypothetical protein